jgi:hypothetical protein
MATSEQEELRMLYQLTVSDLSYFKTQQWNVTYYALLVDAGIIGVAQALSSDITIFDRAVLGILSAVAAISALFVIGKLQRSISVRQSRLDAVRRTFSMAFARAWSAELKGNESLPSVILLRGGIAVTALLTFWLVACRIGGTS